MKSLTIALLCLAAGLGWAAPSDDVVKVHVLTVQERIQNLELINVTLEKKVSEDAEELDAELTAILEETENLEKVETVETEAD